MEELILKLKFNYKNWGVRKIAELLHRDFKVDGIPSETTINKILSSLTGDT